MLRPLCALLALCLCLSAARAACNDPPANFTAAGGFCSPITLSWTNPNLGSGSVITSTIFRGTSPNFAQATQLVIVSNATNHTDNPPASPTPYYYWIRSLNFSAACAFAQSTLVGPIVRSRVDSTAAYPVPFAQAGCLSIAIGWVTHPDTGGYRLYRSAGINEEVLIATFTDPAADGFVDNGVFPGNQYRYKVVPISCGLASPYTDGDIAGPANFGEPFSSHVRVGESAAIGVTTFRPAITSPAPLSTTWYNGNTFQPLPEGAKFSGTSTPTLTINNVTSADAGRYFLNVVTPCNTFSYIVVLSVQPRCKVDFNENGALTIEDLFTYLNAWFAGCP